jgi:hypothetical protein
MDFKREATSGRNRGDSPNLKIASNQIVKELRAATNDLYESPRNAGLESRFGRKLLPPGAETTSIPGRNNPTSRKPCSLKSLGDPERTSSEGGDSGENCLPCLPYPSGRTRFRDKRSLSQVLHRLI